MLAVIAGSALSAAAGAVAVGRVAAEFGVDPLGAATYTVPISVAAGRGGLRPDIALRYSSHDADGGAGAGFGITGLSRIARCPRTVAVDGAVQGVRFSASDRLCLDGRPLVLVAGTHGLDGAEYRTEITNLQRVFARGRQGTGPASFEIQHPDGLTTRLGNDADSRIEADGTAGEVREWVVNQVSDKFGNHVSFSWQDDESTGEALPAEIRWTGDAAGNGARFRLVFDYEARPLADQRHLHRWGASWLRTRRLAAVRYEFDGGTGFGLVHRYRLGYEASNPGSGRSRLASVEQCGPAECLPPTIFTWQSGMQDFGPAVAGPTDHLAAEALLADHDGDGDLDIYVPVNVGGTPRWHVRLASGTTPGIYAATAQNTGVAQYWSGHVLEYDGDSRRDLLAQGPGSPATWFVHRSTGTGAFLPAVDTGLTTATVPSPFVADVDGDGLDDLVYTREFRIRIRRNTGNGFGPEIVSGIDTSTASGASLIPVLTGAGGAPDFDGDGRQDLLIMRGTFGLNADPWYYEGFLSTGTGFEPLFTTPPAWDVVVLDFNGDGMSDLAYRDRQTGWQTRHSLGNALAAPEATGISTTVGQVVRAIDLDGDGRDDLLRRLDAATWRVHLAGGGPTGPVFSNSDAARYVDIGGAPSPAQTGRLVPLDANGDGLPDLIFTDLNGRWHVRSHGGPRPDLLASATDGLGNTFRPAYRTLGTYTGYSRTGTAAAGEYVLRGGPLPVVTAYTANDGRGGTYTMSYNYWNGRMSRVGRGFLGFEKVRATDSRYAPLHGVAVYNEITFRQDFPFVGLPSLVSSRRSDGRKLREKSSTWASRTQPTAAGEPAADHHFPHLQVETEDEYESDPDGGGLGQLARSSRRTLTWDFNHGAPVRETTAVSSPASPAVINTTVTREFSEAARTAQYCLGLPLRVDTTRDISLAGASTRSVQFGWSTATCRQVLEISGPVDKRLVTFRNWNSGGQLAGVVRTPADSSMPVRRTNWTYEAWSDRPLTETVHVDGQVPVVVRSSWNFGLDVEATRTSPRGLVTRWRWDEFARLSEEVLPDGPGSSFSYGGCGADCFSPAAAFRLRAVRTDGHVTTTLHDSYGRTVGREASLAGGRQSRQLTQYDTLGRVARETVPFVAGEPEFWIDYRHDVNGNRRAEERPADEGGGSASTRWNSNVLERVHRDAENRVTTRVLDVEGRTLSITPQGGGGATYTYTAFGELASITDANGTRTTISHDDRGLPLVVDSPDSGRRTSAYNAFGELVTQQDAATPANTIRFSYDQLGRLVQRDDAGQGTTRWEFHQGSGPLLGLPLRVTGPLGTSPAGFSEEYAYDAVGRRVATTTTLDGTAYVTSYGWDALGRVATMTYPATVNGARLHLGFRYDAGHLTGVDQDVSGGGGMWLHLYRLRSQDARGRERLVTLGSVATVDEQHDYDRASLRLRALRTGPALGAQRQDYAYAWDKVGNLLQRHDAGQGLREDFGYDDLDRLTSASLNGAPTVAISYDAGGRIRSKSDVGTYTYADARPNAVQGVAGGPAGPRAYGYDANGNMTSRAGKPITWYPYPLPRRIEHGSGDYTEFSYGPDRQRVRQVARTGGNTVTTWYVGPHFEVEVRGTERRYRSNVFASGEVIYSQVEQAQPATFDAYFLHRDHQGSVDTLTRVVGGGAAVLAQRFDAFGKRRNANWTADPADLLPGAPQFTERGYTGHEHLDNVRLIHMNGRLQDPLVGVMLSPDPVLGDLQRPQTLNRYAYVAGNPSTLVDPSGFFLGRIGKFFKRLISGIGSLIRRVVENYGREILAAVAGFYTGGAASHWYLTSVPAATVGGAATVGAMAGGAVAGGIATGEVRGAVLGSVGGVWMSGVATGFGGEWSLARIGASGAVGGVAAKVGGGSFRDGFYLSAGFAGFGYAYDRIVNYSATWSPGGEAQGKQRFDLPIEGANNFAESRPVIDPDTLRGEGGRLSRFMNRIPGMNAIAGMHDVFQVRLDQFGGDRFGSLLRTSLNYPGMPVAAAMTYPALFDGLPAVALSGAADD